LVIRARDSYAEIFKLMQKDARWRCERISDLERGNEQLEENLTKGIDNAGERVKEAQEFDEKKEEYDISMKRFFERKAQLEEHLKALIAFSSISKAIQFISRLKN
jgi:predicted nuclease with TOPRIM domain